MDAGELRVTLEIGPKGKRVVAVAPDWPGLERGAKTEDAAVERLLAYLPRYAPVAKLAGMESEFAVAGSASVVERYPGNGSTDYWGVSFTFSDFDRQPMSRDELERELRLMRGCWAFFDEVRSKVSPEMRKGLRGGGRDRDRIIRHTIVAEYDMAKKVGIRIPSDAEITEDSLTAYRDDYCRTIREFHTEGKMARSWPLRYLIRHSAYHTLDHSWEMEDKDLTATTAYESA
ncbi:MAG TPA: hypothetical protein VKU87_11425 [Thermomicrobiaceae bacterium]|nr:hypothetical protein [Thermomicrobiaceae bacterium]